MLVGEGSGREGEESGREGGGSGREGGEVGYHSQPHLKVFPLKPQQMEHMSLHLPTGQTLQKATSRTCLGNSPFIVSDAADLPSAVEGAGDAIPLTNARY